MLEKAIEKKVCDYAKKNGVLSFKFKSGQKGVPDRIFMYKSVTVLIEFKQKGKKPTKLQEATIQKLRNTQMRVHVVDDVEEGKQWIDQMVRVGNKCYA